jgi:hypothetical protein
VHDKEVICRAFFFKDARRKKTHGQKNVCRVFLHWRTANTNFAVRFSWRTTNTNFVVRFCIDAQQTFFPTTGRYHLVLPLELELFFVIFAVR